MDEEESKLWKKIKQDPLTPLGILGAVTALGIGVRRMKTATKTQSTSVYLMQLRVIVQATVVGAMCVGMLYNMYKNIQNRKSNG